MQLYPQLNPSVRSSYDRAAVANADQFTWPDSDIGGCKLFNGKLTKNGCHHSRMFGLIHHIWYR